MRIEIRLILAVIYLFSLTFMPQLHLHGQSGKPYALAEAVAAEDSRLVNELLAGGSDVNYPDKSGQYPLSHAVRNGDRALADLLLRRGANPDRTGIYGLTPLMQAVVLARVDILSLLLSYGADLDYVSIGSLHGEESLPRPLSAFTLAVNRREFTLARMLIEQGATPLLSLPFSGGQNPVFSPAVIQPVFKYDIDAIIWQALGQLRHNTVSRDWGLKQNEQWLLHHAARINDLNLLRMGVYKLGLSPDTRSLNGVTPLMVAARYGYFGICSFLIASGADPRLRDNDGRSAVAYASAGGSRELVSLLASRFSDEEYQSPSLTASPYLYALLNEDSAMFHHLFDLGFEWFDLFPEEEITLPMVAAWLGNEFALNLLLPYISSRTDKGGRNTLAWALAAFRREREVADELEQRGRAERLYSLLRRLASVRSLRLNTDRLIVESWSEQPFREAGVRRWRQLSPPPVPLAGERGDYTVHKIIRAEEAID